MQQLTYKEDKNNKTKAFFLSLVIYLGFFALLYFLKIAYQKPEEPLGVALNYGIDLVGSGDIQTLNKANDSPNNYDVKPSESEKEETPAPAKAVVTPPPVVEQPEKVKIKVKEAPEKTILTTKDDEAKIEAKEKTKKVVTKPVKTPPVKTPPVVEAKPTKVVAKPSPPTPAPPKKVERTVDNGSIFKKGGSTSSGSNGTVGTRDGVGGNNNGDGKKGEVGDKGDPRGTLDGKSLYGNPGKGGTGASIAGLQGWSKKKLSVPKDNSDETGKIVFKVTVDDSGDVVGISVAETTVSPSVTNFYKNYLTNKLSSFLIAQGTPPPRSTGTITINIQSGN